MKKEATPKCKGLKTKTYIQKRGSPIMQGDQNKDLRCKKSQPQNARGSKQRPLKKKGAITNMQGV
jgi:hypothetical protein